MSIISDVVVKGISLVCGKESPAVAKASTKFAIMKKKQGFSSDDIEKLKEIIEKSEKIAKKSIT